MSKEMQRQFRAIGETAEELRERVCQFLDEHKLENPHIKSKIDELILMIADLDPEASN